MNIRIVAATALMLLLAGCANTTEHGPNAAFHESLMVLDSHLDTPALFHRPSYQFLSRGSFPADGTHVDLPRMREGGLDGGFWVIYTPQGALTDVGYRRARTMASLRQASIRELAAKHGDVVELAFSADDAQRIHDAGKIVVFQSMENAYPLGEDISLLETFYVGGLRMVGPVHFRNNQFADSATDPKVEHDGLSPLGEELVREANRLGMIVDASHASDAAFADMMRISTTPVILSHSGPDGIYSHPRNVPDELLLELAEKGGVIHVNAFGGYLEELTPTPEHQKVRDELRERFGTNFMNMSKETLAAYREARDAAYKLHPPPRSSFQKFVEHLLYTLELVGPNHVGIGADWDGGGGVEGMEDVASVPKITDVLLTAGYSKDDIAKIWSGNVLRVMREVEAARAVELESPGIVN